MPNTQPITLSAEEYEGLVNYIAQKDPCIAMLLQKQQAAQQAVESTKIVPDMPEMRRQSAPKPVAPKTE